MSLKRSFMVLLAVVIFIQGFDSLAQEAQTRYELGHGNGVMGMGSDQDN